MSNSSFTHVSEEYLRREIEHLRSQLFESEPLKAGFHDTEHYSMILEDLPDLLCLFRPDGRITYANTAFCRFFKKKINETTGTTVYNYIPKKDRTRFAKHIEDLAPHKPLKNFEYRIAPFEGQSQWYEWTLKALFSTSDKPIDYILAGRDITSLKSIEEDLIDALDKYATLFESTKDAIILHDGEHFIDCNNTALKTFRCKDKEIFLRSDFRDYSLPDSSGETDTRKIFQKHFERALKLGVDRFQLKCRRFDGTVFPADIILSPFPLGAKKIVASVVRDITELKETEEALMKSREQYRELVENINDAIFSMDEKGTITYTSPVIKKITGFTPQEMTGRHFTDFVYKEDSDMITSRYSELLSGKIMSIEYRILKKNGTLCWVRAFNKPIMEGESLKIYGVVTDITKQKKAEEALKRAYDELEEKVRERTEELSKTNKKLIQEVHERKKIEDDLRASEERYRMIAEELEVVLNGITDIIMMQDKSLSIIWANEGASLSLNRPRKELMGKKCYELWQHRSTPCEKCPVTRAIESGRPQEETIRTKSGDLWEIMGYPVKDDHGAVRGAIEISRNVTDRKYLEEELQKRYKLDSLGTLAGGIAHDFNNILTVILGNVSFAKMLINNQDKIYSRLDDIEKASMKAKDLTNQILTFSKGGNPLKKSIKIDQLLRDTIHFSLQNSDITARFHTSGSLWSIEADEAQIVQVIKNIILNAKQAMPEGGSITVKADNCTSDVDNNALFIIGNYVKVSIQDTGCGIDEKMLNNIFDPFFTTKQKSHGLGLATSYSILRKHGGHITASSAPGKGTTITLYFPALVQEIKERTEDLNVTYMGKGRILFMDDEAFIRDLARSILAHLGYEVVFACEGNEAIREYKKALKEKSLFDAVILDLTVVEGMGGKECIKELKKIDAGVKAIVSSGYSNDPIMSEPEKYGFSAFIPKPYSIQALSAVLQKAIHGRNLLSEITG